MGPATPVDAGGERGTAKSMADVDEIRRRQRRTECGVCLLFRLGYLFRCRPRPPASSLESKTTSTAKKSQKKKKLGKNPVNRVVDRSRFSR